MHHTRYSPGYLACLSLSPSRKMLRQLPLPSKCLAVHRTYAVPPVMLTAMHVNPEHEGELPTAKEGTWRRTGACISLVADSGRAWGHSWLRSCQERMWNRAASVCFPVSWNINHLKIQRHFVCMLTASLNRKQVCQRKRNKEWREEIRQNLKEKKTEERFHCNC